MKEIYPEKGKREIHKGKRMTISATFSPPSAASCLYQSNSSTNTCRQEEGQAEM